MEPINPVITNIRLDNASYNQLICAIDTKIMWLASKQYFNLIYGKNDYVDIDLYDDLCVYRQIFIDKLLGCNCLNNQDMIYLIAKIKRLIKNFN